MAGITKAQAQAQLDLWLAADAAASRGQEYSIDGKVVKRADAKTIRENITYWTNQVKVATSGGVKFVGGSYRIS